VLDEPRPGPPRTITAERVEEVIVRTLETTPRDATLVDALDGHSGRAHLVGAASIGRRGRVWQPTRVLSPAVWRVGVGSRHGLIAERLP
jgi:hypothetical protein